MIIYIAMSSIDLQKIFQIFFAIITAGSSLGQLTPHLQALAQARGAAYELWSIIDTVR
jgi:hypothetical protein